MGLNKDMTDLINNIKRSMIFYIPRSLFGNLQQKHLDELERVGFLNTLFYMDSKGEPKPIVHGTEYIELLSKSKILKSNVFELLDLKVKLDKNAFHYLIEDYFKELNSNVIFTDVISKEAKDYTSNYDSQIQGYLDLQYNQLIAHQDEVKQKFGTWKSEFETERILIAVGAQFFNSNLSEKVIEISDAISSSEKIKLNKKQKGKVLRLTEDEVDKYLLETTFSVDFSIINRTES